MDAHFRSFERSVLPELVKEGAGVLAMKALGDGCLLESAAASPVECLHYTMNLPISSLITGIDGMEILEQDLEAVKTFRPLTEGRAAGLLARTASRGAFERFKTTNAFDATAQNPGWQGKADEGPA
mgnify:CR=1 FL=1